ncbi:unnamed protein product [Allacma fusca]|uniref:Uncharacterized protein n=1 Tax=Allacma fusca TaxID=39272 RepID=A0A8J2LBE9_9HEXA|nr:unnamed protein product [Allacma fusca]
MDLIRHRSSNWTAVEFLKKSSIQYNPRILLTRPDHGVSSAGKDPRRMLQASSIETITLSDCDDEEGTPVPRKSPEETEALQSTPSSSQNETAGNNDGNNMHLESSRDPPKSVEKNISSTNEDTATDQVTASRNQNDLEEAIKSGNHEMSMRENSKNESSDTGTTDETNPEDGTRYIEESRRHDLTKQKLNKQPSTDRNLEYRYVQSVYFGKMRVKVSPTIPGEWALNEGNAIDQRELISPPTTTEVSLENPVGDSESNQRTTKMNRLSRNWGPLSCRIARKKLNSTKSSVVGSPRDTIPP